VGHLAYLFFHCCRNNLGIPLNSVRGAQFDVFVRCFNALIRSFFSSVPVVDLNLR
jgi:hypothetical protein